MSAQKPAFIRGEVKSQTYPDLLPHHGNDLRSNAIATNYRALVDITPGGGVDILYGQDRVNNDLPIAGTEYLAVGADPRPQADISPATDHLITFVVQIPHYFDLERPCILVAPSPGSRGVYGAVCVGEWGLKNNFAVVYTDKGTGVGLHDLEANEVFAMDGTKVPASTKAQADGAFVALKDEDRIRFNETKPHRFAFKHAHSQANPEQAWGQYVAMSIELALHVLDFHFKKSQPFTPENTTIIASSLSNGAGACLRAAEQFPNLIHGVVAAEPNINPAPDRTVLIQQGNGLPLADHSRSLLDYMTLINVYQGCLASPGINLAAQARCNKLFHKRMLSGSTLAEMALNAQEQISHYGILPEQNDVQAAYWNVSAPQAVSVTFTSAYARLRVDNPILGFSFAKLAAGEPVQSESNSLAQAFAVSNGLVPDWPTGIMLINDDDHDGPTDDRVSGASLEGALKLRSLFLGMNAATHAPLEDTQRAVHEEISKSIKSVQASGNVHGIPTLMVHGRADAIIAPNHTSRPYYAQLLQHGVDNVRYYEVTNATHIDGLIGSPAFPGFAQKYLPLYYYLVQALDLMWQHLQDKKKGVPSPFPKSQVIHTTPRGNNNAISSQNKNTIVPRIADKPAVGTEITFENGLLHIPD